MFHLIDHRSELRYRFFICVRILLPLFSLTEWCSIGLGICYDLRFPELARLYALEGCKFVCFPGAFTT